jgi:O-antigen/teichoic acid export membrane protein
LLVGKDVDDKFPAKHLFSNVLYFIKWRNTLSSIKITYENNSYLVKLTVIAFMIFFSTFFLNLFLSKHLTTAVYGDLMLGIKLITVVSGIITLGTAQGVKKYFPSYIKNGDVTQALQYLRWNIKIVILASFLLLVFVTIMLIMFYLLGFLDANGLSGPHISWLMIIFAPLSAGVSICSAYLLIYRGYVLSFILNRFVQNLIIIAVFFLCIYWLEWVITDYSIVAVMFISLLFSFLIIAATLTKSSADFNEITIRKIMEQNLSVGKDWFKYSLQGLLSTIVMMLYFTLDLLILEVVHPEEEAVGKYAAVLAVTGIMYIVPKNIYKNFSVSIGSCFEEGKIAYLQQELNRLNIFTGIYSFIFAIIVVVFSHFFLKIFGHGYTDVTLPLIIVAIAAGIQNFATPAKLLLFYGGRQKLVIGINVTLLTILVVFGSLFVYWWGIIGIAIATAVAYVLEVCFCVFFVRAQLNIKLFGIF